MPTLFGRFPLSSPNKRVLSAVACSKPRCGQRKMHFKLPTPVFVPYDAPLLPGRLVDRRDRFIAEVSLDDAPDEETVLAHCINPGRMEAFVEVGARVWLLPAARTERKLRFSWEAIEAVGIDGARLICSTNTVRPNRLVRALLEARVLKGLDDFATVQAERSFTVPGEAEGEAAHSGRVDFLLDAASASPHYVEVKNCHMVYEDGWGYFPDSVSERATRHVDALAALARRGARASVILVVQRGDVRHGVRPSGFHDPAFAAAAARAATAGVVFRAVRACVALDGTRMTHELPVDLLGALQPAVIAEVARQWELNRCTQQAHHWPELNPDPNPEPNSNPYPNPDPNPNTAPTTDPNPNPNPSQAHHWLDALRLGTACCQQPFPPPRQGDQGESQGGRGRGQGGYSSGSKDGSQTRSGGGEGQRQGQGEEDRRREGGRSHDGGEGGGECGGDGVCKGGG
jgi:sugar fermentation stimulation protein A